MKDNNIGLARLVGAFLVLAGHMYVLIGALPPVILGTALHRLGIIIFFLLGGYVITLSWERDRHYGRYLIKRFFRIIPALTLYVLIASFIIGPFISRLSIHEYFVHPHFRKYLKNIILNINYVLPAVFENNPYPNAVNGSLWSLPIEVIMYFIVPCLYEISKKYGEKCIYAIATAICILSIIHQAFFNNWHLVLYAIDLAQMIDIIPYYFIGCMIAVAPIDKKIFNLQIASCLIILFQCFSGLGIIANNILCFLGIPYIIFSICFAKPPICNQWISKAEISYGIYLYGFFVQQIVIEQLYRRQIYPPVSLLLIICSCFTIILALLSSIFCEKPSQKLGKILLNRI